MSTDSGSTPVPPCDLCGETEFRPWCDADGDQRHWPECVACGHVCGHDGADKRRTAWLEASRG